MASQPHSRTARSHRYVFLQFTPQGQLTVSDPFLLQNDQIDVALNSFLASKALDKPADKLSPEGKALVKDFRGVVTQAKNLLLSKNEGNLLQDFIWQTTQFDPNAVGTPGAPVNKETAQQHGDKALQGLRTLGTLIITNGQFRKLRTFTRRNPSP